ncbi:MAG: hypothetical protein DI537_32850 [Stutzerimonas stutzeri]|nr:MAG: hypothetical protein DI537_32850 [Stutzerimonas stutzeri]
MRILIVFALIAFASGASAGDRTILSKRYETASSVKTLVEAAMPFFDDISRACGMVRHLVPELEANYGQDSTRDDAYVSISSCCSTVDQTNVLSIANALAQIASPTRNEIINFVYSSASEPIHASIDSQLSAARAAVSGHCKKVPVLATVLTSAVKTR